MVVLVVQLVDIEVVLVDMADLLVEILVPVLAVMEDSSVLEVAVVVLMVMAALVDLDTTAAEAAVVDGTKTLMRVVTSVAVAAEDLLTLVVFQVLHQTQTVLH